MDDLERAAGFLGETPESHDLLSALGDTSPLIRHVAALRLAERSPRSLPERSIRELLETLDGLQHRRPIDLADEYSEFTGDDNDLGQDIVLALAMLGPGQADFAIPQLLEHWRSDPSFYELAIALLALTVAARPSPFPPDHLTGTQRFVLGSLLENGPIWTACAGFGKSLEVRGLPATRDGMRKFLDNRDRDG